MEFFLLIALIFIVAYAAVIITKSVDETKYHELLKENDDCWESTINSNTDKYMSMISEAQQMYNNLKFDYDNLETAFQNMRNSNEHMGTMIDNLKKSKSHIESENNGLKIAAVQWKAAFDNLEKEMSDKEAEHQTQIEELTRYYEEEISKWKLTTTINNDQVEDDNYAD